MPTAATVTDVSDIVGRSLAADTARVERLIVRAEGILAGDMPGLTFGAAAETVTLEADGDSYLTCPRYPVTGITSITINGSALAATDYTFDILGRIKRRSALITETAGGGGTRVNWPDAGVDIVVAYSYGFAASAVPPYMTGVVAELAAGRVINPEQRAQESLGDRSVSFASTAGSGDQLTAGQRNLLRNWRRNRFASARIRT
jgi:hypothetical protein